MSIQQIWIWRLFQEKHYAGGGCKGGRDTEKWATTLSPPSVQSNGTQRKEIKQEREDKHTSKK